MPYKTSDLLDARPDAPVCAVPMHLHGTCEAIAGRIRTIRCCEDNALIEATISQPSNGEVLIVDGCKSVRTALMGDRLAGLSRANGWAGVIVFGAIRDRSAIEMMNFHVKALATNPRKSAKSGSGERDVVLEIGGISFVPGEFVYSDADGIVVLANPLEEVWT